MQKFPCLDLINHMSMVIGSPTIKFFEKKGIQFFEPFKAVARFRKPVNVHFDPEPDTFASIQVSDLGGKRLGFYDLEFKKDESLIDGKQLFADVERENIGEILSLASFIEFSKNKFKTFKFFSLKETLPFHARYGFLIENDDPYYIMNGLKAVMKSKINYVDDLKRSATLLYQKIRTNRDYFSQDKATLDQGCKVISDYLKIIGRNDLKKHTPDMVNGTYVKLTDEGLSANRNYLTMLAKKHGIDYRF